MSTTETHLSRPAHCAGPVSLLAALLSLAPATAQTTMAAVSPADRAVLEGSSSTAYPLGRHDARYQQLFLDVGKLSTIKGHAYRREALGSRGVVAGFQVRLAVSLSTTKRRPDAIRRVFADNLGASPSAVLPTSWVSFPQTARPATPPGDFVFLVPYRTPYVWSGQDTLCVDITVAGNQTGNGADKNFNPSLDAQQLYASGRNPQPGYPFGSGCKSQANSGRAAAVFEVRHLGGRLDLNIASRNGVPTTVAGTGQSILLLSPTARTVPWPPGTGCNLYGVPTVVLPLAGDNDAAGTWSGTLDVGIPPPPSFEMVGQILSHSMSTGETVLSNASRLITPPPGRGVVSARVVSASDRTATSGTTSFAVPITGFCRRPR